MMSLERKKMSTVSRNLAHMEACVVDRVILADFIETYKEFPCLWDYSLPSYKNVLERKQAWAVLAKKLKNLDPDANIVSAKGKIGHMKSAYHREMKRIKESQKTATSPEQIHKPVLWYFEMMKFLDKNETLREETMAKRIKRRKRKERKVKILTSTATASSDDDNEPLKKAPKTLPTEHQSDIHSTSKTHVTSTTLPLKISPNPMHNIVMPTPPIVMPTLVNVPENLRTTNTITLTIPTTHSNTNTTTHSAAITYSTTHTIQSSQTTTHILQPTSTDSHTAHTSTHSTPSTQTTPALRPVFTTFIPEPPRPRGRPKLVHLRSNTEEPDMTPSPRDNPQPSIAYGLYVSEKLEELSTDQRVIAEKLISDVIFLARTNNLCLNSRVEAGQPVLVGNLNSSQSSQPHLYMQIEPLVSPNNNLEGDENVPEIHIPEHLYPESLVQTTNIYSDVNPNSESLGIQVRNVKSLSQAQQGSVIQSSSHTQTAALSQFISPTNTHIPHTSTVFTNSSPSSQATKSLSIEAIDDLDLKNEIIIKEEGIEEED